MKKVKVKVTVITFIHKETKATKSFVFDENRDTSDSFEGSIFGEHYNCSGFWKAEGAVTKLGHLSVTTETEIEVEINLSELVK